MRFPLTFLVLIAAHAFTIRAAESSSSKDADGVELKADYEKFHHVSVSIAAPKSFIGKSAKVVSADGEVSGTLREKDGKARLVLALPAIPAGKTAAPVGVFVDEKLRTSLTLPDLTELRMAEFLDSNFFFDNYIFSGPDFPTGHFGKTGVIENLHVPCTLNFEFYNHDFQKVSSAEKPGRYGAVVSILENGRMMTRYATLFRLPPGANWTEADVLKMEPEKLSNLDPKRIRKSRDTVDPYFLKLLKYEGEQPDVAAQILSGLFEPEVALNAHGSFGALISTNQKWHYGLLCKLGQQRLPYLPYVPKDAEPLTGRWPLLVFLHGSGERGYDLPAVSRHGPQKVIDAGHELPFIVVSPQCPPCEFWNPWQIRDLVNEACAKYPIDKDRVYLTGLSLGGFGAWHTAAEFPELFAAVAPVAGKSSVLDAPRLKDLPIWNFHGKLDTDVPEKFSEEMVRALVNAHARVKFTLFANRGHQCWTSVYDEFTLYEWLLKQKRGAPEQPAAASFEAATIIDESK